MDPRALLRALMTQHKTNPTRLAAELKRLGKTKVNIQSNLSRWLSNPNLEPTMATMRPVADYFGLDVRAFYDEKVASEMSGKPSARSAEIAQSDNVKSTLGRTANTQAVTDELTVPATLSLEEARLVRAYRLLPEHCKPEAISDMEDWLGMWLEHLQRDAARRAENDEAVGGSDDQDPRASGLDARKPASRKATPPPQQKPRLKRPPK